MGEDAVLTAAHCVFKRDGQGGGSFYSSLDFAAGRYNDGNGAVNPYNITSWAFATIFDTYKTVPDSYQFDWDVSIIRLASKVGQKAGWLGIATGCAVNANTGLPVSQYGVSTAGYAAASPFGTCSMSVCSIFKDDCNSRTAYHSCPSLPGQSGSPFYIAKDNRVRGVLVGTYTGGSTPLKVAHIAGTTSYPTLLQWIQEPMKSAVSNDAVSNDITQMASPPKLGTSNNMTSNNGTGGSGSVNQGPIAAVDKQTPPSPPPPRPSPPRPSPPAKATGTNTPSKVDIMKDVGLTGNANETQTSGSLKHKPPPPSPKGGVNLTASLKSSGNSTHHRLRRLRHTRLLRRVRLHR